jgi:hypothetical protein
LQRYFTLAQGERRDVIQKIRPMLEAYCRNLYPTQFADQDSLGIMIGKKSARRELAIRLHPSPTPSTKSTAIAAATTTRRTRTRRTNPSTMPN